jgi:hypothetical protein
MFLPGANEALAETALLDECANRQAVFANPKCVFSYSLAKGNEKCGSFELYSSGLRARHDAIAAACDSKPGGVVRYIDIKKFYPTIEIGLAERIWRKHAQSAQLPALFQELGERLILDHKASAPPNEKGVLTGPMFSHLLANLVLRDFDEALSSKMPGRYFRYVDDITLVGDAGEVAGGIAEIMSRLRDLGFELHGEDSPKNLEVPAATWLEGRHDYHESKRQVSWMTVISDLKHLLLTDRSARKRIQEAFQSQGIRIPVHDYSTAAYERSSLERVIELAQYPWYRWKKRHASVESLVSQAIWLRDNYEKELREMLLAQAPVGFARKRLIPKLRYRSGRLAYLARPETLTDLGKALNGYQELHFHAEVMTAVASKNLDRLLPLGPNASQAAAQPLRAAGVRCKTSASLTDEATRQSLAVFILNGVPVDRQEDAQHEDSDLLRLAHTGANAALMKSEDSFIRELACLHGLNAVPRHPEMLESVFDEDEHLAIDAVEQLQDSASA